MVLQALSELKDPNISQDLIFSRKKICILKWDFSRAGTALVRLLKGHLKSAKFSLRYTKVLHQISNNP